MQLILMRCVCRESVSVSVSVCVCVHMHNVCLTDVCLYTLLGLHTECD